MTLAEVEITRPKGWFGRFRKLELAVDGTIRAKLRPGETVRLSLECGTHSFQIGMDWCWSPEVRAECGPHRTVRFECRSLGPWGMLGAVRDHPERVFELVRLDGGA